MALAPGEIEVWWTDADGVAAAPERTAALEALLGPTERARRARRRSGRRAAVAYALARLALSRHAPVPPAAWRFAVAGSGRPGWRTPDGGSPLGASLSHAGGLVACAVSTEPVLGVDLERAERVRDPHALARRFFAPEEAELLDALGLAAARERFLVSWTLKEAYVKARGLGLARALSELCVLGDARGPLRVRFASELGETPEHWDFASRALRPGICLGVAARVGAGGIRLRVHEGLPGLAPAASGNSSRAGCRPMEG